jgi:hypothetical protein
MKVHIKEDATSGKMIIPKGEYTVALQVESQQIGLVAGGKTLKIAATRRRSTSKVRVTTVTYYCGGGKSWSLVVSTPKHGEWIAMIDYQQGASK